MRAFMEGYEARQSGASEAPFAAFRYHKGLRELTFMCSAGNISTQLCFLCCPHEMD